MEKEKNPPSKKKIQGSKIDSEALKDLLKEKDKNRKKKEERINPEILKKLLKKEEKKDQKKDEGVKEVDKKKETLEEEISEDEIFNVPLEKAVDKKKLNTSLEETLGTEDDLKDYNLEDTLGGVETKKKETSDKNFYSSVGNVYGPKNELGDNKYASPINSGHTNLRQNEVGPLSVSDIRKNPFVTTLANPEIQSELRKYSSGSDDEEKYNVSNLDILNPNDQNRKRKSNPFLSDIQDIQLDYK